MTVPPSLVADTIESLAALLTPDVRGQVLFGANHQPLKESQVEGLTGVKTALEEGVTLGHIVQPGGTGKTREGIALAYALDRHNRNSLFVVPTQQALEDFVEKAKALCPDLHVGAMYQEEKQIGRLTFITYASLLERIKAFEESTQPKEGPPVNPGDFDLVVWDEAHMYLTPTAQSTLQKFDHAINIGLTATPRYYEGKEVSQVFGKKLHEITLDKARERGEISDFENILVTTDIHTGLQLTTPDQEESAEVSHAINRRDRNLVPADIYKTKQVTVPRTGHTYSIAGEPTVVFGAGIDHVHALADSINAALQPALKYDNAFRQTLIEKGINPDDPDLVIAAPIHSGGTDAHNGMSLDARNKLVDKYHARKVLMLVSTSVLQQSFDSPMTSVVIDTVPRQTYVGVGQAGMRATRPGKEMAFIINMQHADHSSLTFEDFRNARGFEEGVAVQIGRRPGAANGRGKQAAVEATDLPVSNYKLTYGTALSTLAKQRREKRDQFVRDDYEDSSRHFTSQGYDNIARLLIEVGTGNKEAITPFVQAIQPWVDRTRDRLIEVAASNSAWQIKRVRVEKFQSPGTGATGDRQGDRVVEPGTYYVAGKDTIGSVNRKLGLKIRGAPDTTIGELLHDETANTALRGQQLDIGDCRLTIVERAPPLDEQKLGSAINEALLSTLRIAEGGGLSTWPQFQVRLLTGIKSRFGKLQREHHDVGEEPLSRGIERQWATEEKVESEPDKSLGEAIEEALKTLTYREREVVRSVTMEGSPYRPLAEHFEVSKSRLGQIEHKAIAKLQRPFRSDPLKPYVEGRVKDVDHDSPIPRERTVSELEYMKGRSPERFKDEPLGAPRKPLKSDGGFQRSYRDDIAGNRWQSYLREADIDELRNLARSFFVTSMGKTIAVPEVAARVGSADWRGGMQALGIALDASRDPATIDPGALDMSANTITKIASRLGIGRDDASERARFVDVTQELFRKLRQAAQSSAASDSLDRSGPVR